MQVREQFVQVGERRVLVRYAGQGPAVVLLHQSPESSLSLLPWFGHLAGSYAVFAPDTPGFGWSDPLPTAQPTVPDLAAALARLLQALGLQRVLLYGVHTGAAIAARLARDRPDLVEGLVCDGLSAFTPQERQPLLDGYLPPFEPSWDGTHLLWLWARIREQTLFFPWHTATATARIAYPLAQPAAIHKSVMELLDAGDGYRAGYRAPLLYEHGAAGAAQLAVPARLLYRQADVLRPHMQRLPALPAHVQAHEVADASALQAATSAAFAGWTAQATQVDAAACVAGAASATRRLVHTANGVLSFVAAGGHTQHCELVLPDIGTPAAVPAHSAPGAQVLALDLPGHGASSGYGVSSVSNDAWLADVQAALDSFAVQQVHLHATGASCAFAVGLAQRLGTRCVALSLADPLPLSATEAALWLSGLPDLNPHATGAHLIAAWNWARLKHLFWPWLPPNAQAAVIAPAPPPRRVHADTVEMLRAAPLLHSLWHRAFDATPWAALHSAPWPVQVRSSAHPVRQAMAQRLGISPVQPV
jgi:pimeloyl-ACP methyl ester carboxylesterase